MASSGTRSAASKRPRKDPLIEAFKRHVVHTVGKPLALATPYDHYRALACATREALVERMIATREAQASTPIKRAYYLSLEWLIGHSLRSNLIALERLETCRAALDSMDVDLNDLFEIEPDAGLGNGGLGRLAACYLESAATLGLPVDGYGLRYDYGLFTQQIVGGWQVERPDDWLRYGSPWEIVRPDYATTVRLFGQVKAGVDNGKYRPRWTDTQTVMGVPCDVPVIGFGGQNVSILRLWSARAPESLDFDAFNRGGYLEAVQQKVRAETLTKVLYPNDDNPAGKELRLTQQYFFVACTLADILRRFDRSGRPLDELPAAVAIQLNDTHPALAVVELMRILLDERGLGWDEAWRLSCAVFSYTNHTLLPEALETWPVDLVARVLPRHAQILFELNRRLMEDVETRWPGDDGRKQRISLVQEQPQRAFRMAHLAILGSHAVNGVAQLHSQLVRTRLVPDLAAMWPQRFCNVTNGVTPRRWLLSCNPKLAEAIAKRIGKGWITNLDELGKLEPYADDAELQAELRAVRLENKRRLAQHIRGAMGVSVSPDALFDAHIKRLHEYKRQLLNILHVIIRYQRILEGGGKEVGPRVVIFAAKAAPAYGRAKLIIKLIHSVAEIVNRDPRVGDKLRVVFLPNYNVSLAERIIPATDLSEQTSTAGMEASGTGNMKLAMNGALTIGTLDGANIEIREAVGAENFFLFGLTADEVAQQRPGYDPWRRYHGSPVTRRALDSLVDGQFCPEQPDQFREVFSGLTHERDPYMVLADLEYYLEAQQRVDDLWRQPAAWMRAALLTIARMGRFSSDRSMGEYAQRIWRIEPLAPAPPADARPPKSRARKPRAAAKPGAKPSTSDDRPAAGAPKPTAASALKPTVAGAGKATAAGDVPRPIAAAPPRK